MSCLQSVSCQRSDTLLRLRSELPDAPTAQTNNKVIPRSWYQHLRYGRRESDINALMILTDMMFKQDHNSRGPLQQDPHYYVNLLGLSESQVKSAFKRLGNLGMLRRLSLVTQGLSQGRLCLSPMPTNNRVLNEFQPKQFQEKVK